MSYLGGFECHPIDGRRDVPAFVGDNNGKVAASFVNHKTGEKQLFISDTDADVCGAIINNVLIVVTKQPFYTLGVFRLGEDDVDGYLPCTTFSRIPVRPEVTDEKVYQLQPVEDLLNEGQLEALKYELADKLKSIYNPERAVETYGVNLDFIKEYL